MPALPERRVPVRPQPRPRCPHRRLALPHPPLPLPLPARPPPPPRRRRAEARMSRFFIDRPIFAWVIALFVIVIGAAAITRLPVAQYPSVAPPAIVITTAYPG